MPSSLTRFLPFVLGFSPHLPVSVCGTGALLLDSNFSRQREIPCFATYFHSASHPSLSVRVLHYAPASMLAPALPSTGSGYPSVSLLLSCAKGGTGISTSCPSPTTFVLGLGPDLPRADEPSPGNLRLSTVKFLTSLSLLIPAFSLVSSPLVLPLQLLPVTHCSSTNVYTFRDFGVRF